MVTPSVPSSPPADESCQVLPNSANLSFDWDRFLARCLGNQAFAERILTKFFRVFTDDVAEIEQARRNGDADALARLAHRLKGSAANVSAYRVRDILAMIESQARQQQLDQVPPYLELLHSEWGRFVAQAEEKKGSPMEA